MKKVLLCACAALLAVAGIVIGDDLVGSITESNYLLGGVNRTDLDWQSGTNGVVSVDVDWSIRGRIERVVVVPDSGGTQPTDNYDMTLDDEDNVDLLSAQAANLDNATTYNLCGGVTVYDGASSNAIPFVVNGTLTLEITNAGSENGGIVRIYWRP